jgi:hypothetical protein
MSDNDIDAARADIDVTIELFLAGVLHVLEENPDIQPIMLLAAIFGDLYLQEKEMVRLATEGDERKNTVYDMAKACIIHSMLGQTENLRTTLKLLYPDDEGMIDKRIDRLNARHS